MLQLASQPLHFQFEILAYVTTRLLLRDRKLDHVFRHCFRTRALRSKRNCGGVRRRWTHTLHSALYAFGQLTHALWPREQNVRKDSLRGYALQITCAHSFHQLLVIQTLYKSASANHREFSFTAQLDRLRKTRKSCVTLVFDSPARFDCSGVGRAAIRITERRMLRGILKGVANRVVIGHNHRGWLMSINQQKGQSRRLR